MAGRVRRPSDKEEILTLLVENEENSNRPFDSRYRAMTFAAALGFARGERAPIEDYEQGLSIRWDLFKEVGADELAAMIAFASTGDLTIVAPDRVEEQIAIFEEFSNGGLGLIGAELAKGEPADAVIGLILAAEGTPDDTGALQMDSLAESFSSDD